MTFITNSIYLLEWNLTKQWIIADFPQTILNHCPTAKVLCIAIVQPRSAYTWNFIQFKSPNKFLRSWSRGIIGTSVRLQVICQLRRAENIMFLSAELGRDFQIMVMMRPSLTDDGFCLPQPRGSVLTSPFSQVAPPFASGVVFLSAMLDRLTVQCYYNRDLLSILQAIRWIFHNSFAVTQPSHRYHPGMCGIWTIVVQALVSTGNTSIEDFSTSDVQPSELCSLPVPRRSRSQSLWIITSS